ncbi:AsnC family transcriptional regulator [Streptomyces sp. NPDC046881]|uniref:Lrp/AsnC family transcriptional regulator n=1 Tax=Streptomyces sp. NPDC046881 TaxID=3155374 RepID=UPI0033D2B787
MRERDAAMTEAGADPVVRGLLHALQIDGRVSFSAVGEVLGVSDQTVARRYRRLHGTGSVRVTGLTWPGSAGEEHWLVRVGCAPDAAAGLARGLAQRPETEWVQLVSGGAEILCMVRTRDAVGGRAATVFSRLPRSPRVTRLDAHEILHVFAGGQNSPLVKRGPLSAEQVARLSAGVPAAVPGSRTEGPRAGDAPLLAELARDGRAGFRELSAATGWSPTAVRRRVNELRRSGGLYFDVDFSPALLGLSCEAALWLSVAPADLPAAGAALAGHPEVAFAAATTGPTNLYTSVQVRDARALYAYLTGPVAALPGVRDVQTAPVLQTLKRTSTQTERGV